MGVLLLGETPRGGGLWWDFALALGYACLAMMGVQFWLTARFKRMAAPFGIDIVYYFHRYLAATAFVLLVGHALVLLIRYPAVAGGFAPSDWPPHMLLGWLSLAAFSALMASSLWRKRLRIEYDRWRRVHALLAVFGIIAAVLHALGSGSYLGTDWKRWLWTLLAVSWVGLFLWVRVLRPAQLSRRPWRVAEVRKEAGRCWRVRVEPEDGEVFPYMAGQFAWLTLRASPWAMREHPFSFLSSPTRPGALEFAIKELGDFTSTIGNIQPGERAWVDGPYGHFGVDRLPQARGFVFVAGGVGIAPVVSMLRSLADRGDRRPLWLFYGNRRADRIALREELDALAAALDLRLVHVLSEPPTDWPGETGFITLEVMRRHLPQDLSGLHFMVCGPDPMIRLVERNAEALGLPLRHLHSEIFDLA